jgi:hypothetical protein
MNLLVVTCKEASEERKEMGELQVDEFLCCGREILIRDKEARNENQNR